VTCGCLLCADRRHETSKKIDERVARLIAHFGTACDGYRVMRNHCDALCPEPTPTISPREGGRSIPPR
jgi:hypothetical protein